MENIIKKAIEGGWKEHFGDKNVRMVLSDKTGWWYEWDSEDEDGNPTVLSNPCCYDHIQYQYPLIMNPLFWQALGKACGWSKDGWCRAGIAFHQKNLTEGWDKAVEYLKEITN